MTEYMQLNESELRQYVKKHPQDEEAFQYFLSVIRSKPNRVVTSTEEQFLEDLKKRISS